MFPLPENSCMEGGGATFFAVRVGIARTILLEVGRDGHELFTEVGTPTWVARR